MDKSSKRIKLTKKMKKKLRLFYMKVLACSLTLLAIGVIVDTINNNSTEGSTSKTTANVNVSINSKELLKHEDIFPHVAKINKFLSMNKISDENIEEMIAKINDYLGDDINKVSISYYDINSGKNFNINEKVELKAASTVKVPVSMMLYDAINNGEITEQSTMLYRNGDYEASFGGIGYEDLSKPKTFEHINECMIIYSDNVAVNMLLRYFGNNRRYDYIEAIVGHEVNRKGNISTAEDTMKILKHLYFNPNNNPHYGKIIELMKKTSFHDRLDKLIPQENVAHKIGDYQDNTGNYVHDVGIIYGKKPYILVVMTKNLGNTYDRIAQISKIVYDEQVE